MRSKLWCVLGSYNPKLPCCWTSLRAYDETSRRKYPSVCILCTTRLTLKMKSDRNEHWQASGCIMHHQDSTPCLVCNDWPRVRAANDVSIAACFPRRLLIPSAIGKISPDVVYEYVHAQWTCRRTEPKTVHRWIYLRQISHGVESRDSNALEVTNLLLNSQ